MENMGDMERAEKSADFNIRHPEINPETETFFGNFRTEDFDKLTQIQKKRMGTQAYDHFGRPLESDLHPVFVDKEEYAPTARSAATIKQIIWSEPSYRTEQEEMWREDRKRIAEQRRKLKGGEPTQKQE